MNIKKWVSNFNWKKHSKIIQLRTKLFFSEGYKNGNVEFLTIKTTSEIWVSMKDVGNSMGVQNVSDLVLKEIYGNCDTKNPTKKQINEDKMTKREFY